MSNLSLFLAISGFLFSAYLFIAGGAYLAVWRLGRVWFLSVSFLLPLHPYAVGAHLLLLTAFGAISHLGYEFYRPAASRWLITSTYHQIHHASGKRHFTLRFKWWDHWMGSDSRDYKAQLQRMEDVREPLRYDGGHERTTNTL